MALLSIPRPLFLLSLAPHIGSSSRTRRHPCSCSLSLQQTTSRPQKSDAGSAILWFKQDLRVDDHPGLVQAAKFPSLVPLYVFDHQILSRYSDEMLELVLFALEGLRLSLKEQGSNLMIRFGNAEDVIKDLVLNVKGTDVFAEEEVEYHLRQMLDVVEETLVKTPSGNAEIVLWRTPFYDVKNLKELSSSYEEFMKLKLPVTSPVVAPTLPGANMELDWGIIPTLDELKKFVNDNPTKLKESWSSIRDLSTESILLKKLAKSRGNNLSNKSSVPIQRKRPQNTVFVTSKGNVVGGGTSKILNGLAAYLRYLEGTGRDDWQELHEKLRNAEVKEGASFLQLFGPALNLGIISKRRVHYETIKYEKERNGGFLSPFGYSTANVAAVADAVCSTEWYRLLGLKSQISDEVKYPIRIWRWNGYLIQYTVTGSEGPATLLVHGFGAFLEHYRDNIHNISEGRNRVWAITVLGFGKSEKPNVVYTELMWAELLRDFVIEVVGEPVHLVGNSIGGYFVALFACFWPALVKSIVLINSAGDIIPGYTYQLFNKERSTSGVAWLGARLLLSFLRLNLKSIVRNCYPTKSERADDWLMDEMLRASYDPGVLIVLESIFSFDLSLPLNYLLEGFEQKVLIIQGMKDPISNSQTKVAMLKEHCAGVMVREVNAGHCPHDEQPEVVNSLICEWLVTVESKVMAGSVF